MSLKSQVTLSSPTGYDKHVVDEHIVITGFKNVELSRATGGFSQWPLIGCIRSSYWNQLSEEDRAERILPGYSMSLPSSTAANVDDWVESLVVGGGHSSAAKWVVEVLKEVNGRDPCFT